MSKRAAFAACGAAAIALHVAGAHAQQPRGPAQPQQQQAQVPQQPPQQQQPQEQDDAADQRADALVPEENAFTLPAELRRPCGREIAAIEEQLRDRVIPTDVREDVQSLLRRAGSTRAGQCQPLVLAARERLAEFLPTEIVPGGARAERFVPRVPETTTIDTPNLDEEPPEPLVLDARIPRELEQRTDEPQADTSRAAQSADGDAEADEEEG